MRGESEIERFVFVLVVVVMTCVDILLPSGRCLYEMKIVYCRSDETSTSENEIYFKATAMAPRR